MVLSSSSRPHDLNLEMLKRTEGAWGGDCAKISDPLGVFCKNSQMLSSCHIWRTVTGEEGAWHWGQGQGPLGKCTPINATLDSAKNTETNNLTPGRQQGRSSCQCRLVKPALFLYVTGWQIWLAEANACLVTASPAERSQASAATVWSRQIYCVVGTEQPGKHYSESSSD